MTTLNEDIETVLRVFNDAAPSCDSLSVGEERAIARLLARQMWECERPKAGPRYTDAAGSTDYDLIPCGLCPPCRLNKKLKEIV